MQKNNNAGFVIEEKCPKCQGKGTINSRECLECGGKGTVLTETGKKILKYLEDSIRLSEH